MISVRLDSEVARHAGNAALAAATAASTSSAEAKSTHLACAPVAGLNTGPAAAGRARDATAADPVADRRAARSRRSPRALRAGSSRGLLLRRAAAGLFPPLYSGSRHGATGAPGAAPCRRRLRRSDPGSCRRIGPVGLGSGEARRVRPAGPETGDSSRIVDHRRSASAPVAITIASTWSADSGPRTAGSRHVKATAIRAMAHRAMPNRNAPARRRANRPDASTARHHREDADRGSAS